MNKLLNPYQLNAILTTLRSFEENLRQADEWLSGKEEVAILYRRKLSLSDEKQQAAREQIAFALDQITDLVARLDPQPEDDNPANLMRGQFAVSWANLMECRAKNLERYGELDPSLAQVLDPSINGLAMTAIRLARLFNHTDTDL